jgi:hypothetical protein
MKKITVDMLKGACKDQRKLFRATFPKGAPVTMASLKKAEKAGLDIWWVARLAGPAYEAQRKVLDDAYWAQRNPLDDAYWAQRKPLDDAYWAQLNPMYAAYEAQRKVLDDAYRAQLNPLYAANEAQRKVLLIKCLRGEE